MWILCLVRTLLTLEFVMAAVETTTLLGEKVDPAVHINSYLNPFQRVQNDSTLKADGTIRIIPI